jgi:hypothetical protein
MLVIGSITCLPSLSSEAKEQGKETAITQQDEILLNNTDYNQTIAQYAPNLGDVNITSRIIIEYGDFAITQALTGGIPSFQIPPRIIVEYADYASFIGLPLQSYPGPDVAPTILILSPENMTYNVTNVPLTFTVDQTTSWMGYSLDGESNITVSGNTTLIGLTDGVHKVIVFANNTANVMGVSNTTFFTIQTLAITNVSQDPLATNVTPTDVVSVNATVTDSVSTVTQVSLNYTNGNGTWITANMTNLQGNIWNSTIPAFPYGTNVTYIVRATDSIGNTITTQQLGYTYQYVVVSEFTALPIVLLFLMATLLTVLIRTRKRPKRAQALIYDAPQPHQRRIIVNFF